MFEDVPEGATIMYPSGTMKTKAEVKQDYPVLGTPIGLIGITVKSDGKMTNPILMGYYDNIISFESNYEAQGVVFTEDMTNAQKCDAVTEFVNQPKEAE